MLSPRFARDTKEGKAVRELIASDRALTQYEVTVVTGSIVNAGTDANVNIVLYGNKVFILLSLFL